MPSNGAQEYNLATIRQLLLAAFIPEELRRFCYDRFPFRPLVDLFGPGLGAVDMVDRVVEYCDRHVLLDQLLTEVKRTNPRQYARFEPELRAIKVEEPQEDQQAPPTSEIPIITSPPITQDKKPRDGTPTKPHPQIPPDRRKLNRILLVIGIVVVAAVFVSAYLVIQKIGSTPDPTAQTVQSAIAPTTLAVQTTPPTTPSSTPALSNTPTPSPRPSDTPTSTPSGTPTPTKTVTPSPTPTVTSSPTPSTRITQPKGETAETSRETRVEWEPSHQPMIVQFYRGGHLIKEEPNAQSGEIGLEWAPPGEVEIKIWIQGEPTPAAYVTITVAPPSGCEQAKFVNPNGIRDVEPDPGKLLGVPKETTIMWEPKDCRMDIEFNQYGTLIKKLFDVGSGEADFTWMEGSGQTEIKIWFPGSPDPSDAMQISVE